MFTKIGKCMWPVISTVVLKLKDFKASGSYIHWIVVISQKWCKTEALLLQTT